MLKVEALSHRWTEGIGARKLRTLLTCGREAAAPER
jgi:hypothetical protein